MAKVPNMNQDVRADETNELIASDKVEGTDVYNMQGESLGKIENFMVNKRSGKVEYAVLQFGGFLGIGSDYYPLPWNKLTYDNDKDGYVVDIDKVDPSKKRRATATRSRCTTAPTGSACTATTASTTHSDAGFHPAGTAPLSTGRLLLPGPPTVGGPPATAATGSPPNRTSATGSGSVRRTCMPPA